MTATREHALVPDDIVDDMKEIGLFGISIPEEFGGIGHSLAQECEVAHALGQTALAFPRWPAPTSGSARRAS